MKAKQGDWVRIHTTVLSAADRSGRLPEDTRKAPVELWVKGRLQADSSVGERVEVETATGRRVAGELIDTAPVWGHGFGDFVPELEEIGRQLKQAMQALDAHGGKP
ncbi:MAG: 2-amino-4-oxopentanoate thiolase subunit OrtA [Xanthomonadales bacterium]|nr:2-amino-4-oxopentanoate thiolase subunit OrtA [Xanthomonadales bacterium]